LIHASASLRDQIALAERRVQLEKLQLKVAAQGLRSSALAAVSGPVGLMALFLAAAAAGSVGGRKLAKH
jgi:hypothetical protein